MSNDEYTNLTPGIIYRVHEGGEIIPHVAAYDYDRHVVSKQFQTFSDNGNRFKYKIAICPQCGRRKKGSQIRSALCKNCQRDVYKGVDYQNRKSARRTARAITGWYMKVDDRPPLTFEDMIIV